MVALAKNSDRLKPQQPRARFAQQTPGSKRFEIQIRLQVYQRARYYDPTTGEFIEQDPIGFINGPSLFRGYFVLKNSDPSGLAVCCTYYDGNKRWTWELAGYSYGESAEERCKRRYAGIWGGWISHWTVVKAKMGFCKGPNEPDEFYVCGRELEELRKAKGMVGQCARLMAQCTRVQHADVYTRIRGKIRNGMGGGANSPEKLPIHHPEYWCKKLKRSRSATTSLRWGQKGWTSCANATDAQIIDCIKKSPVPSYNNDKAIPDYPYNVNCQTDCEQATESCCLSGFKGRCLDDLADANNFYGPIIPMF